MTCDAMWTSRILQCHGGRPAAHRSPYMHVDQAILRKTGVAARRRGERVWVGVCARAFGGQQPASRSGCSTWGVAWLPHPAAAGDPSAGAPAIRPMRGTGRCRADRHGLLPIPSPGRCLSRYSPRSSSPMCPGSGAARCRSPAARRPARILSHDSTAARTGWRGIQTLDR